VFVTEAKLLAGIVREFADGRLIDLACGTGYWLPFYAERCSHITLFDQSEKMLAECRRKLDRLSLGDRSVVLQGDLFEYKFGFRRYDCALVGSFSVTFPNHKSRNCSTRSA
jgi:ubiquinone/menaquinone biosynthesis C-methylase UbiE